MPVGLFDPAKFSKLNTDSFFVYKLAHLCILYREKIKQQLNRLLLVWFFFWLNCHNTIRELIKGIIAEKFFWLLDIVTACSIISRLHDRANIELARPANI